MVVTTGGYNDIAITTFLKQKQGCKMVINFLKQRHDFSIPGTDSTEAFVVKVIDEVQKQSFKH